MATIPAHKPLQYLANYQSSEPLQNTWIISYFDVDLYYGEYLVPTFKDPVILEGQFSAELAYDVRGMPSPGIPVHARWARFLLELKTRFV